LDQPRKNEYIRRSPVRLIDEDGQQVGVIAVQEALQKARDAGLDLVEVSANTVPPVCKIMDYGRYLYELKKSEKKQKSTNKTDVKEIRMGLRTDQHDLQTKLKKAKEFLADKDRVRVNLRLRGRDHVHRDIGEKKIKEFVSLLHEVAELDGTIRSQGSVFTADLTPRKQPLKKEQDETENQIQRQEESKGN